MIQTVFRYLHTSSAGVLGLLAEFQVPVGPSAHGSLRVEPGWIYETMFQVKAGNLFVYIYIYCFFFLAAIPRID